MPGTASGTTRAGAQAHRTLIAGLVVAGLVAWRLVAGGPVDELLFGEGAALTGARWLQALGLLAALVSALVLVVRRATLGVNRRRRASDPVARAARACRAGRRPAGAVGDRRRGPGRLRRQHRTARALLVRELARRVGWGWPSIIMLAFALGILQAGVIDQSLFSSDWRDIETWAGSLAATYIGPLGLSATNAVGFVLGTWSTASARPSRSPRRGGRRRLAPRGSAFAAASWRRWCTCSRRRWCCRTSSRTAPRRCSSRDRWRPPGCASVPRSGWGAGPTASGTRALRRACR